MAKSHNLKTSRTKTKANSSNKPLINRKTAASRTRGTLSRNSSSKSHA